jgi:UDPglucose 6-dehydrogenase
MVTIAILGTGYVGLVSGACLADFGNNVICVDINKSKIELLKQGKIPIYEPGLDIVVQRNIAGNRLHFSTELIEAINKCDVIFIAVGTPPAKDGSADLSYIENAAHEIGKTLRGYKVIVNKSTVPIGTGKKVSELIKEEIISRINSGILQHGEAEFDVVSNPEFLREGAAIQDFMHPDRIVIGTESKRARLVMKNVYNTLYINETPYIETNRETAEMIKYAANAFLAVKITYINEIANLCEKVGANVQDVAKAIGRDARIGAKFLHPGPGYGGSCFPKDTQALATLACTAGNPLQLVETTISANEHQKQRMIMKIEQGMGGKDYHLIDDNLILSALLEVIIYQGANKRK